MRLQNPLSAVGTIGLDSQVLQVLCGTEQLLSAAQITQLLPEEGTRQGVQKSLGRLVEQGLVTDMTVGRSRAYSLNRRHLLADAVVAMSRARAALLSRITALVDTWSTAPTTVTLFGSAARGEMRSDSDIDLLVVIPDDADDDIFDTQIHELASAVHSWTGNDVRPLVYRESEVSPAPIFTEIVAQGIHVAGNRSWLRRQLR
ncbi:nucleotidyltransferase domain-containing protein [Corynebacterium sp.]|uniref:nucleotidyltransferase domain-containing protein n=1 Tax=Corynebacterium sp. TaxID=1720 RepID=UPI0026E0541C|nr:nucleotidyltransferase domain-containing protein [Corynebacterium sp.]MDO5512211.1 nucleotidyltransferase domain-containing protein [Corynebacterium sp.]